MQPILHANLNQRYNTKLVLSVLLTPLQVVQLASIVEDRHCIGHDPKQIVDQAQKVVGLYHLFLLRADCLPAWRCERHTGFAWRQVRNTPRKARCFCSSRLLCPTEWRRNKITPTQHSQRHTMWHNTGINVPVARTVAERPSSVRWRSRVRHSASSKIGPQVISTLPASRPMSPAAILRAKINFVKTKIFKCFLACSYIIRYTENINVPALRKVALTACFSQWLKIGSQVNSPHLFHTNSYYNCMRIAIVRR